MGREKKGGVSTEWTLGSRLSKLTCPVLIILGLCTGQSYSLVGGGSVYPCPVLQIERLHLTRSQGRIVMPDQEGQGQGEQSLSFVDIVRQISHSRAASLALGQLPFPLILRIACILDKLRGCVCPSSIRN